jgi:hypothetical protein
MDSTKGEDRFNARLTTYTNLVEQLGPGCQFVWEITDLWTGLDEDSDENGGCVDSLNCEPGDGACSFMAPCT